MNIDEAVTYLYKMFKGWSKRKFTADDVTWCEVKDALENVFTEKDKTIKELEDLLLKYEELISHIHGSCLCERSTNGFDYHETHPKLGRAEGRWKTPCDSIEASIGFKWKYADPEKPGDSWKELGFKFLPKRPGFY